MGEIAFRPPRAELFRWVEAFVKVAADKATQQWVHPVLLVERDAAEDTMRILKETGRFREHPGVIHCYSYSPEQAKEYVKMGYCIGVGGVVTFKNAKKLKETVAEIGLPHIVLETDCPYMAPEPHRGTRNDSRNLIYVVKTIAELTGTTPEEVEAVTWENAKKLFQKVR